MRTIRSNCFETNSSSTHSITIDDSYLGKTDPKDAYITPGEFGWQYNRFNDFATKASYFWTFVQNYPESDLHSRLDRLSIKYGFNLVYPTKKDDYYSYVDHGSEHYANFIAKYPELNTDEGLMNFLMSESGWIMLGNDNDHDTPNFRLTPNQVKASPYHLILNEDPTLSFAMDEYSEEKIGGFASEAAYQFLDKGRSYEDGWSRILSVEDGVIKAVTEKYDYKNDKTNVIKEHTLHYTIKSK